MRADSHIPFAHPAIVLWTVYFRHSGDIRMTKRRSWAVVAVAAVVALLSGRPAGGQTIDPAFEADLKALMEITGAAAIGTQMATLTADQFLIGLRKAQPQIPERAGEIIKEVLNAEFAKAFEGPDGLMPQLIAIYA